LPALRRSLLTIEEMMDDSDDEDHSDDEAREDRRATHKNKGIRLQTRDVSLIKRLLTVVEYVFADSERCVADFRAVVLRFMRDVHVPAPGSGFRRKPGATLSLWCMNPAVIFRALAQEAQSVIVTSGTLAPLTTFRSELGVDFPHTMEAAHVIGADQILASMVSCGPSGALMHGTFKNTQTFEWQDNVGQLVLDVCERVPFGVLVFLPSYALLERLHARYATCGMTTIVST
jgi:fanconi anemia group J protein